MGASRRADDPGRGAATDSGGSRRRDRRRDRRRIDPGADDRRRRAAPPVERRHRGLRRRTAPSSTTPTPTIAPGSTGAAAAWTSGVSGRHTATTRARNVPDRVVRSLDRFTDDILGRLEDPHREGPWDTRGMVVGSVQSGKTSNYTGLICKAADAGYNFIVVLAGLHNSLRSQTQARLDEGFLGLDSRPAVTGSQTSAIGVGAGGRRHPAVTTLTSSEERGDFSVAVASRLASRIDERSPPVLLVVKKNRIDPREPDQLGHAEQRPTSTRTPAASSCGDSRCSSSTTRPTTRASTRRTTIQVVTRRPTRRRSTG